MKVRYFLIGLVLSFGLLGLACKVFAASKDLTPDEKFAIADAKAKVAILLIQESQVSQARANAQAVLNSTVDGVIAAHKLTGKAKLDLDGYKLVENEQNQKSGKK